MTQKSEFVSPADRLILSLPGTYYKLTQVAQILDKSPTTIRRITKSNKVKAPSYQIKQGHNMYYLFTPEDLTELKNYYGNEKPESRHAREDHDQEQV